MNPKAKPALLIIAIMLLAIAALSGQSHRTDKKDDPATIPTISVMLNFDTVIK